MVLLIYPYISYFINFNYYLSIRRLFCIPVGSSIDAVLGSNRTEAGRTPVPQSTFDGLKQIDACGKRKRVGHVVFTHVVAS